MNYFLNLLSLICFYFFCKYPQKETLKGGGRFQILINTSKVFKKKQINKQIQFQTKQEKKHPNRKDIFIQVICMCKHILNA